MRLALFSDGLYPFTMGGMQKHTTNLARYFARNRIQVSLFTFLPPGSNLATVFTPHELSFIELVEVPFPSAKKYPGHYIRESYLYAKNIFHALEKRGYQDIDFIYAQGFTAWYTLKARVRHQHFPPVGINFHGLEMFQLTFGWKNRVQQMLFRPYVKKNIRRADVYFSLGARISDLAKKISPGVRVAELPVAVDTTWLDQPKRLNQPGDNISFVFVGRYERRKGLEELITALNRLTAPCVIHFIGEIPPHVTSTLTRSSQAVFHGPLFEEQKIKHILMDSDVLVCPSYAEGMPTVIIEAMASSLAILATDVGAVNELVDDTNGWLIQAGNIDQLVQTLQAITNVDRHTLLKKQQASRTKMESRFTWDKVMEKTIEEIKKRLS